MTVFEATAEGEGQDAPSAPIYVRAGSRDITPTRLPIRLAGYVGRTQPADTVLDPLEVSVLLLECGDRRCLIASFDLLFVGEALRSRIVSAAAPFGFEPGDILLFASHTHSAPATDPSLPELGAVDDGYVEFVADAVAGLLKELDGQPADEAVVEVRQGDLNHSINRRLKWPFPTVTRSGVTQAGVVMGPNPSGPKHERASLIVFARKGGGRPLCVLWNYACHSTSIVAGSAISADFPGAVRGGLRARLGTLPCLFIPGFCGDLRPNLRPRPVGNIAERLRRVLRLVRAGPGFEVVEPAELSRWSNDLADRVAAFLDQAPLVSADASALSAGTSTVPVEAFFEGASRIATLAVNVVRLRGCFEIVALSAEPSVEWMPIVDRERPPATSTVRLYAGYLDSVFGYLPAPRHVAEGGYEVTGFQTSFGMSGRFDAQRLSRAVPAAVAEALSACGEAGRHLNGQYQ